MNYWAFKSKTHLQVMSKQSTLNKVNNDSTVYAQKECQCLLTHPGKYHPGGSISSSSHSHPHRRGPLGVQSSPRGSDPAPARHHGPWSRGKAAGVCGDLPLHSAPGWRWNFPAVWSSPSHLRSPAGWPELCLSYLEGFGRIDCYFENELYKANGPFKREY